MDGAKQRITVVGSANVDMVVRLERLPAVGETVTGGEFFQVFGGKGANQAVAAARACGKETEVAFVACVGEDALGSAMVEGYRADGIDTSFVVRTPDRPSGTALIWVDRRGNNSIAVAPGANDALTPAHLDACEELLRASALLVLQMEIPAETIGRTLELAERHSVPVLFNFAPARTEEIPVSARMTGLVVNEVEAEALTGRPVTDHDTARDAARALLERGPRFVVVTLGEQGALVAERGADAVSVPAFPVEPIDATAAGDTFCGALAAAVVEGKPLREAARFASAASALSVTRMGAQPSCPRRAEIDAFLEERTLV